MKGTSIIFVLGFLLVVLLTGCGESVASNEEDLKNMQTKPSNNPDLGVVDGANTEFGPSARKGGKMPN